MREKFLKILLPDKYYSSVNQINLINLKKEGVRGLIIDLDNTIVPRKDEIVTEEIKDWFKLLSSLGFRVCLVSNNWSSRASKIAEELKIPLIAPAGKPRRKAFRRGLELLGMEVEQVAVIGDQLFTDILGGNLLKMKTILVSPMSSQDLFHTQLLRKLERRILRNIKLEK